MRLELEIRRAMQLGHSKCQIYPRRIFPIPCVFLQRTLSSGLPDTIHQHSSRVRCQTGVQSYFLSDAIATLLGGEDGDVGVERIEEGGEGLWGPKALGALGM